MLRRTLPVSAAFAFSLSVSAFALAQGVMPDNNSKTPTARGASRAGASKAGAPAAGAAKTSNEPAPTVEEIKQLIADGKQREALQKLSRALALRGDSAAQYDRHELLRLKAESHLGLKDAPAASSAFAMAAKEAKDDAARAEDKASELVIKRSKNLQFTPKAGKKGEKAEPIDVVDPEKRKAAFAALLEEEKVTVAPVLKAAKGSKTLPPIVEALKQSGDLRMLELAATGADTETAKEIEGLAGGAQKLMDNAVQDMASLVKDIEASANDVQPVAVPARSPGGRGPIMYQSAKRRGLTTRDTQDLKRTIGDLKKLVPMARDLAASLGEQGKPFEKIADDGEAVGNQAQKVLTTDYTDNGSGNQGLQRPTEIRRR